MEWRWYRLQGYLQIPALTNTLGEGYYLHLREQQSLT